MQVRFRVRNRVCIFVRDKYANGAGRVLRHLHCAEYRKPLFCHNLQAAEVVNCKIKVVYVEIQTVLDRLAMYPLVAY